MKKKIGIAFMISGLVFILFASALLLYNNYESKLAEERSKALMNSIADSVNQNQTQVDPFDEEMKVVEIDGYGYIGYLSVPALNRNLPVMSEWDYTRLKIAPCRYYGSTKTDNLVIAAHNYKSHFGYIGKLEHGDAVMFTDMDGNKKTYTVTSVEELKPTDTDKVKDTGDDLILYTCTYRGASRIVVRCSEDI